MSTRPWIASLVGLIGTVALVPVNDGCTALECADGTHESDGTCVPNDDHAVGTTCGPGTHLEATNCVPDWDPTICDPLTTAPDIDPETGIITCIGTGGGGCDTNLPCPTGPTSGKNNVCGRLYDVQTDQAIQAAAPQAKECGAGGADDGPCQLKVDFYDALQFAGNPNTTPLSVGHLYLDDCGRFIATDVAHPSLGFMGIGVDDASGQPDSVRKTGVAFPVTAGQVVSGEKTYVVTVATDEDWSGDVGFNAGESFVDRGVFVSLFLYHNQPVSGVTVTASDAPNAAHDYYMDDTDPMSRTSVSTTQSTTGPNGIGMVESVAGILSYSGTGAEPNGCVWPHNQGAAIPGVMFFNPRIAEIDPTHVCP